MPLFLHTLIRLAIQSFVVYTCKQVCDIFVCKKKIVQYVPKEVCLTLHVRVCMTCSIITVSTRYCNVGSVKGSVKDY